MASDDIRNLLKSGIEAARSGNKVIAEQIFRQVIALDSQNETAWFWIASVVESTAERERALQRVLTINPNNERAQQILEKLRTKRGASPTPPPRTTPPPPPPPATMPEVAPEPPPQAQPAQSTPESVLFAAIEPEPTPPPRTTPPPPQQRPATPPPPPQRTSATPPLPRPPQAGNRGGISAPVYYTGIALALIFIVAAILLALQSGGDNEETTTPEAIAETPTLGTPLPTNTPLPPSATPRPRNTLSPDNVIVQGGVLPATWTPVPTNTQPPPPTATTEPSNPADFELIFSSPTQGSGAEALWLVRGDGSEQREFSVDLSQAETSGAELLSNAGLIDPAFSPDGRFLAFTVQVSANNQEIFVLNLQSNGLRQLSTTGEREVSGATWSQDGQSIAFSDGSDILITDVSSGSIINVTNGVGQNIDPTWSPISNQLVFASDRMTPGEFEIWTVASVGGGATQLTDAVNTSYSPAFSSDGTKIAFISDRGGDSDLYVMNADGSDETLLSINDSNATDFEPAWSPDDNWIVVSSNRGGETTPQLWLVNPVSMEWRKVTDNQFASRTADWRPN